MKHKKRRQFRSNSNPFYPYSISVAANAVLKDDKKLKSSCGWASHVYLDVETDLKWWCYGPNDVSHFFLS